MRILFFGTPSFAIPSLEALIKGEDKIIGVVTQPDRPKGRGRRPSPPPIKLLAEGHNLPIYQPRVAKEKEFIDLIRNLEPDLIVVVAYGQILPKEILDIPPLGAIGVHPSLLPKYRGAAPINWAIINGERITGVTIFRLCEKLDSGDIILQRAIEILPGETAGGLSDRLAKFGADLLLEAIKDIKEGRIHLVKQDEGLASYAPCLKKEDGLIDWERSAKEIANLICGLDPWPTAYTYLNGELLKLFKAKVASLDKVAEPGTILEIESKGMKVATRDGAVLIEEIQRAGKKRLKVSEFVKGHPISPGKKLG